MSKGITTHSDSVEHKRDDRTTESAAEHALLGKARAYYATAQTLDRAQCVPLIESVDRLLDAGRKLGDPSIIGQLLRYAALIRVQHDQAAAEAVLLVDELVAYAGRHGLVALLADAHALRAKRFIAQGQEDLALTEIAIALATLDDHPKGNIIYGHLAYLRVLCTVLIDISLVLQRIGVFEIAEEIMARAAGHAEQIGSEHLRVVLLINQVDLHIDWGRRLERVNYAARAQQHYDRAALIAALTEQRYPSSMFARDGGGSPADQDPALAVARAYTEPGRAHYQRLRAHLQTGQPSSTIASVALGLARCHEHEGDYAEAVRLLSTVAQRHGADRAEPLVWTSLHRELARLTQLEQGSAPPSEVLDYLDQLEGELWDMRAGRISILRTRREHHRLTMAHGTIAAQALQDPLTELPNRRALDERFTEIVDNPAQFPISVALLDLDGFKLVNDRISHAKGDEVLRIIAGALRSALRTDDLIARYGGDEFVVLLAGASLAAAKAAMHRSVAAVAALPQQAAMGVTISVGVIAMHQQESPESALARADAAMYEAKRRGGNSVIGQEGS